MRLSSKDAAYLREIEVDAISGATTGGKTDNAKAVDTLRQRLQNLERAGYAWAAGVLDDATDAGLLRRIKSRVKSMRIFVTVAGRSASIPAAFSDAGQLSFWMMYERAQIVALIDDLTAQRDTLGINVDTLRFALVLMDKHGVSTPKEAFDAEGIDPTEAIELPA